MKLKIFAKTAVVDKKSGELVNDAARIATLDGVASDECFSDYLLDDPLTKALPSKGVSGGYLRFCFRGDSHKLFAETEYDLREPLTGEEIKALVKYTMSQWSDGIGENFSQSFADESGVFLSINCESAQVDVA